MNSPVQIRYPAELCADRQVSNECPPGYKYKVPFAVPLYNSCTLGRFVIQLFKGEDYWLELWDFTLKLNGYVDLIIHKAHISITLFLKGHSRGRFPGNDFVWPPAKTYNMFYWPEGIQRVDLQQGEYMLLFIVPPQYHLNRMAEEHTGINDLLHRLTRQSPEGMQLLNLPLPNKAWRLMKQLEINSNSGAALDLDVRKFMLEILGLYNGQLRRGVIDEPGFVTTEKKAFTIREYILANLGDGNLGGLNEMTLKFHVTAKPLTKEFKLLTGKTVPQFITDGRMEWANRLLAEKELRVFEIALIVGYSDTANFIRAYKRKYGVSPRNRNNRNSE